MTNKKDNGRTKAETKRNTAITILNLIDPKTFTFYYLGKAYSLDPKRISEIVQTNREGVLGGYPQLASFAK